MTAKELLNEIFDNPDGFLADWIKEAEKDNKFEYYNVGDCANDILKVKYRDISLQEFSGIVGTIMRIRTMVIKMYINGGLDAAKSELANWSRCKNYMAIFVS